MKIAIIYHLYQNVENLKESLDSLFNQGSKNLEIIFIDDNMTNEVYEVFKSYDISKKNHIKLISMPENYGRSFTYNLALSQTKADYVYFSESRCIFEPNFVTKLIEIIGDKKYDFVNFLTKANAKDRENDELGDFESQKDKTPKFIVNTKLSIKDKVFRRKFLLDSKIHFIDYKNYYPIFIFEVLENTKIAYFSKEVLIEWKPAKFGSLYNYNLYDILESATVLYSKINEAQIEDDKKDSYMIWISIIILFEFIGKMKNSYANNEKIISKAVDNADELIQKLDFQYKKNENLNLLSDAKKKDYIKNFKPSISYVRKNFPDNFTKG